MPELPEVETVCRGLVAILKDKTLKEIILRRENLRYPLPPLFAERLRGKTIETVSRRAKYILVSFHNDPYMLVIHLGMSGRFRIEPCSRFEAGKHDHVIFITDGAQTIAYNDARRFGLMDLVSKERWLEHALFKHLGHEPFDADFTSILFHERLKKRQQSIKQVLLDQGLIVGIGNIYASEGLWESQISPFRMANTLSLLDCEKLLQSLRLVLTRALEAGGSTLRDYHHPDGEFGYFQNQFQAYGRSDQPCLRDQCGGTIAKQTQMGRSSYFCPACQV